MHVALIACKAFVSSANAIRFPLCLPVPHFSILCLCMGVREEVLLNSTRKCNSVLQHHSNSMVMLLIPCHQCPFTTILPPLQLAGQRLQWEQCNRPPSLTSTASAARVCHVALFNTPEISFKPKWESRPDRYTRKTSLIQLKCDCYWDYSLPCFNSPKPEKHINK